MTTVCVSGGFDPIHHGHIVLLEEAADYGKVLVLLNSDEWLRKKKGYVFMDWRYRRKILESIKYVDRVAPVDDLIDGTVCAALEAYMPTYFANGGDRTAENTPELKLCEKLGIIPLFGIGGPKVASSSDIVRHGIGWTRINEV